MKRTIVIGDVHGCFDELEELLQKVGATSADDVILSGDITRKGPSADRCIELVLRGRARAILGNRDAALLKRSHQPLPWWAAGTSNRRVLHRPELVEEIARWPLFIDLPHIGVAVVHAGVLPNAIRFTPDLVRREEALQLRYVRRDSSGEWRMVPKGKEKEGDRFWSELWSGDRTIVYGHTPRKEPRVDAKAIGIDTGCVYGGALTAVVFDDRGKWQFESVPATKKYARK